VCWPSFIKLLWFDFVELIGMAAEVRSRPMADKLRDKEKKRQREKDHKKKVATLNPKP
jgi:hypothetical protein